MDEATVFANSTEAKVATPFVLTASMYLTAADTIPIDYFILKQERKLVQRQNGFFFPDI